MWGRVWREGWRRRQVSENGTRFVSHDRVRAGMAPVLRPVWRRWRNVAACEHCLPIPIVEPGYKRNRRKCLISKEKNLVTGDQRGSKNRCIPADGFDTGLASKSASGGHVGLRSVPQAAGHRLPSRLRFPKRGTTRGEAGLLLEVSQHVAELPKCVRPLYAPLRPFTPVFAATPVTGLVGFLVSHPRCPGA